MLINELERKARVKSHLQEVEATSKKTAQKKGRPSGSKNKTQEKKEDKVC